MTSASHRSPPTQQQFHQAISSGADVWFGACFRITGDASLAQDAVQDALLNAWRKRRQFQGTARLETWIHRIAINSAIAVVRKHRPERWQPLDEEPEAATRSPLEAVIDEQMYGDLGQALSQLSDMERVCFVMKHLEEFRLKDIAVALDTSVGPVKQALFRALGKLRNRMTSLKGEV
ncbi:MAG: sigma-70 family RNA polymerase sigma factor [Gammaproteobacteria bacterium]|nr:sigma-70 family RNA polymerase sigma factor [Gammaproteobacteria bacterium]